VTRKITAMRQRFVDEYVVDLNGKQAAIRAGYSVNAAAGQAARLLIIANVQEAIVKAKSKRIERTKIDADYVLKRLVEIDEMDVIDILHGDGSMRAITDWPVCWRRTISGLDLQEIMSGDTQTVLRKIKWPDKVKNLELLGKHVDVQAFKEQKQLTGDLTVTNLIADISKRNAENRVVLPKMTKK